MKKTLLNILNPLQWIKAYQFHQANAKFDKSTYDLELYLYSKVLKSDMLHYGYFENIDIAAEDISLKAIEDAQIKYAQNIIDLIKNKDGLINTIVCSTKSDTKVNMLLRWRNHAGILNPAWQISLKR